MGVIYRLSNYKSWKRIRLPVWYYLYCMWLFIYLYIVISFISQNNNNLSPYYARLQITCLKTFMYKIYATLYNHTNTVLSQLEFKTAATLSKKDHLYICERVKHAMSNTNVTRYSMRCRTKLFNGSA